jgi:hypothetical protein
MYVFLAFTCSSHRLGFVAQDDMETAEEEAEAKPVFWADDGLKILDDVGKERVIAPEILFDPQLIEMDEWVCDGSNKERKK